jgi:hypothetical protein
MRYIILLISWVLASCSFNQYNPDKFELKMESDCKNLFGSYTFNLDKFKSLNNLGFWDLRDYEQFHVNKSTLGILFSGNKGDSLRTHEVTEDDYICSNGVLTVNIPNIFTNDGGVSVYQARKVEFYSYKKYQVSMRISETSSGLVFLVPVVLSEDSLAELFLIK